MGTKTSPILHVVGDHGGVFVKSMGFVPSGGLGSVWRGLRVGWVARLRADDSPRFGREKIDRLGVATVAETWPRRAHDK